MRIQFDLPEEKVNELKSLMATIGVDTYKDLFNNALTLLDWTVSEVKAGRSIAAVDETANKYRELAMPIFEHAAKQAARERLEKARTEQQPPLVSSAR
jgi:hypothetical protein